MTEDPEDRALGEYRLLQCIVETPLLRRWLAEQTSVGRRVLVDELKPEQSAERPHFLAGVRAKAAVDHPLIGSVYEAVARDDEACFFAHEWLPGSSLDQRLGASASLKPIQLAHVLRRVAEASLHLEAAAISTEPLGLAHIHLDDHGVIRLQNLAIAGPRAEFESQRDILHLGNNLIGLVADGQPGTTRLLTLLSWMRGEGIEAPLGWKQVRDLANQIEQQLTEPSSSPGAPTTAASKKRSPQALLPLVLGGVGLILIGIAVFALKSRPGANPKPPGPGKLADAVLVPAGPHPTPDGTTESLPAFRIAAHEVTIGQYAEFLDILATLSKNQRDRIFDHESQPAAKASHLPDDWSNLILAARQNATWSGRPVTLDSPVVGVDWWDAAAYAEWKQARLPTQEEWFAALRKDFPRPIGLPAAPWQPVTTATRDRTPAGITHLAGSVAEWTRRPAANPANPLGERKWVIIGGSFLKPGSNALSREWVDDRSLRRPDLGFRLVFDAK